MISSKDFSNIYDKYVDKIYRFVFLKVNSEFLAQDLTSETFTRTLEYFNANKNQNTGNINNMQAFLYRIASNIVIDYYRQKSRTDVPLDYISAEMVDREVSEQHSADFLAVQSENMSQIKDALQKLDYEHANIVMWHYIDDMPIKEIARILERPEGTIRVMLHRGLKDLRHYLA